MVGIGFHVDCLIGRRKAVFSLIKLKNQGLLAMLLKMVKSEEDCLHFHEAQKSRGLKLR